METTVEERGEEEIALEGDVESFSLFAVAEIETTQTGSTDEEQTDSDDGETTDDGDDGGSQTGLIIVGLIALVAVAGAAIYARNNDML